MSTNTGNENYNAVRFTAARHQRDSPFNKVNVTANRTPIGGASTAADPLPWAAASNHSFYTDTAAAVPSKFMTVPVNTKITAFSFSGSVTTAAPGNVSLGLAIAPNSPPTVAIGTFPVGIGAISFSETGVLSLGPYAVDMYPVFSFDVNVTAVTVAPRVSFNYLSPA